MNLSAKHDQTNVTTDGWRIIAKRPYRPVLSDDMLILCQTETDTVWQRIARLGEKMKGDLPTDLAAQHDHYLHGRPKR